MSEQVTNYKCPSCLAPLHFREKSGKLECDYCGGKFDVAKIEALYADKDKKAQESFEQERKNEAESYWNMSGLSQNWGTEATGMREYSCPSCGAELITDKTTAAISCPYCGNPAIIPGQFADTLRPDYIIPFKLDKEAAKRALKRHYRWKIFLPGAFSSANHIDEMQGIYVPFWLFDAEAEVDCTFRTTRSVTILRGRHRVTTTSHYDVHRAGKVAFEKIPTDASTKMPDDYMDSIEPFDYKELTSFSTAYLPGYLADKFDVSAQDSAARADNRCRKSAIDYMRRDVKGYETVQIISDRVRLSRGKVYYALCPVWTLRTKWEKKEYLFMMNGQTGKMVGDLPSSKTKTMVLLAVLSVLFSILMIYWHVGESIIDMILSS